MPTESPKIIGDATLTMVQNRISMISSGVKSDIAEARFLKTAGLEGVTDPNEKIFSALARHIETHGMDESSTRQFASLGRALSEDAPSYIKEAHEAYRRGKEMHESALKSATKSVPEVVDTSKFTTETPEEMAERLRTEKISAETDARIKKTIDETKPAPLTEAEIAERKAKQDELFRKKPVDEAPPSKLRRNINRPQTLSSSRSCAY